jgi:hypothetical protein
MTVSSAGAVAQADSRNAAARSRKWKVGRLMDAGVLG